MSNACGVLLWYVQSWIVKVFVRGFTITIRISKILTNRAPGPNSIRYLLCDDSSTLRPPFLSCPSGQTAGTKA